MISGVLIFNQKGENLIFRAFRNDCRPRLADVFRIQVISNAQVRSPILTLGSTTFSHVKHENIYLVAITKSNANAALVFEFLYRLIQLGKGYFGKFDEEAVKNNFVLVYELLDEIIDFGYPQNTETDTLKMYITTEGVKSEVRPEDTSKITMQATGALSWRKADVRYRKNEAFVDVIEDVNLLMSATGAVLRADVTGQIVMRAYLSGTPECKFGLNDRLLLDNDGLQSYPSGNRTGSKATKAAAGSVTLEDCQFHQCVKLGKFDTDRIISFVPPDGEFELMRYRSTENVNLPFKVHAIVNEVGRTKVEYSIGVKANFGSKLFATNVIVKIPTPLNTAKIIERCTQGKAKYEPSENNIVWKIGRFTGQSEYVLSAEALLTSMTNQRAWSRPPLSMNFSLLMFTSSGLLVRYLKVFEKSNYSSVKWVRYMTRAVPTTWRKQCGLFLCITMFTCAHPWARVVPPSSCPVHRPFDSTCDGDAALLGLPLGSTLPGATGQNLVNMHCPRLLRDAPHTTPHHCHSMTHLAVDVMYAEWRWLCDERWTSEITPQPWFANLRTDLIVLG
ncbi:adaptor protein complex AP-2, medium chain [Drechmeria coniospora]|uniref:Adaptor protein complex AP-2, medium chain n=1 Tax=Drechmeria coniospora TaxID=98403 RepID=A0A151GJ70_DRECN|nr:adaptor protein complex AP-2, medium chain [Drechmeria coniospora]KYK57173.1 adaptor protein complex AP-2, medium chain [Drechmeria coniospora]